jgi:hypothetical protein
VVVVVAVAIVAGKDMAEQNPNRFRPENEDAANLQEVLDYVKVPAVVGE